LIQTSELFEQLARLTDARIGFYRSKAVKFFQKRDRKNEVYAVSLWHSVYQTTAALIVSRQYALIGQVWKQQLMDPDIVTEIDEDIRQWAQECGIIIPESGDDPQVV
jgi:hypothetical protein